ncbi:hypothetical protein GCM10011344_33410 [Dokdonia pacifica]|uniref:Uncharacterized protein n=1 Tax=Dokdonia pacifica TaxID=1627892 RepID=A0A239BGT5_9FLAO|nr:hypothetical protein [Dokdonia pacifica]GGG29821.1 hypothetical protein GCM10011344_33410 [Dokdonia pacifica]SNS06304.1 hypothetical protein SAMN06265376_106116 [Dokdonia pacifica]
MEKYIQDIEHINEYINNTLSKEERQVFEKQLENDAEFNSLYEEHLTFLGGVERIELKQEIQTARKGYLRTKWIKYLVIGIGIIGLSIAIYSVVSKEDPVQTSTPTTTQRQHTIQKGKDAVSSIEIKSNDSITHIKVAETKDRIIIDQENQDTVLYTNEAQIKNPLHTYPKKTPEVYMINTQRDTVIIGKEGTKLTIKANSFKHTGTDEIATGIVTVALSEFYQLSDILLANLSTKSNEQLLETGGMLYVEARSGEALLALDKDITIEIPTEDKKDDMQLFTGQETTQGINWVLDNASEVVEVDELLEEIVNVPFAVIEEVPSFPECQNLSKEDQMECVRNVFQRIVNRSFNADAIQRSTSDNNLRIFTSFTIDTNGDITKINSRPAFPGIQEEVERVLGLVPRLSPGKQRGIAVNTLYSLPIFVKFEGSTTNRGRDVANRDTVATRRNINTRNQDTINFRTSTIQLPIITNDTVFYGGRTVIEDIKEILHTNDVKIDTAFVDRYENYKKKRLIQERRIKGERYVFIRKAVLDDPNSGFTILPTDSITRGGNVIRKRWDETQIPDRQFARLVPRQPGASNYLFTASRLGWINCDRFVRSNTTTKYKVKIKDSDGTDVKIVFKRIRSILPSQFTTDGFDFGYVPKGEEVTLVAIKIVDNQYQLAIKDINTDRIEDLDLEFKAYTVKALQEKLKKLNDQF